MLATRSNFERVLAPFRTESRVILDTETTGLRCWTTDQIVSVILGTPSLKHAVYFPIRHEAGENVTQAQYGRLRELLSDPAKVWSGWNIKFDFEMLMQDGVAFPEHLEDVMLACHHLNENDKPFELKRWASKYVHPSAGDAEDDLIETIKQLCKARGIRCLKGEEKQFLRLLDPADVEWYGCDDVRWTERLRRLALPNLKLWKTRHLWRESNEYLLETMQMEVRGMQLDVPLIRKYSKEARREYKRAYVVLSDAAGFEINTNSPKQLCKFLGTTSSAKAIVDELGTPEAEALLTCRSWDKVERDYYQKWLTFRSRTDVLHPNLLLHGTGTGRQSAREPPLHGTPRYRKEYKVKDVIVARPGYVLISADYNQLELRVAASIAEELQMAAVFLAGGDIHQSVADLLYTSRDMAKNINFMMLYGGGAGKLARMAKIPLEQAERHMANYRATYWRLRYVARKMTRIAEAQGYIRLWTGRVRHFNHPVFAQPKDAFNSAVQGGGAEMLRIAICRMGPQLRAINTWLLLQIHDQVIAEVPVSRIKPAVKIIRREMENFTHWLVPPKVDFKIGPRWGQLDKLEAA
jgi:DNA polymerase-1